MGNKPRLCGGNRYFHETNLSVAHVLDGRGYTQGVYAPMKPHRQGIDSNSLNFLDLVRQGYAQ